MRILIVEDEIRIREGIRRLLNKIDPDYEIIGEAADGGEGLSLSRSLNPDLIITDVQMPVMDGLQMLQGLHDEGIETKAIVLSAYSEFEYARGAMKLGVTEYLVKPINISEFSLALESIKRQIETDKQKKPDQIGTLDQILREIISGRMELDNEIADYLYKQYEISNDQKYIILPLYLGNSYEDEAKTSKKKVEHLLSMYGDIKYCVLEVEYRRTILAVIYGYKNSSDIERWIQLQALQQIEENTAMGFMEVEGISALQQGFEALFPYMDWNIAFSNNVLISYPKITQVQTSLCVYPHDIESQIKSAICAVDLAREKELIHKFSECFNDGKVYDPHEIKECYVRFIWAILEIAKDVGNKRAAEVNQQRLLEQIMNAKTRAELYEICGTILQTFEIPEEDSDTMNLTVRRTKSMIHEFYNTGITLDEIASRLNITPEYLGTQFHKETGVTFSTYIKNYRIAKAKELLLGTSMKLYEIADRVGYSDPKYFSKVFRDTTGQLPAEYRKTAK